MARALATEFFPIYDDDARGPGECLVFADSIPGRSVDVRVVCHRFRWLGFSVKVYRNLSPDEVRTTISLYRLSDAACLVIWILSTNVEGLTDACTLVADGSRPVVVIAQTISPPKIFLEAPLEVVQISGDGPVDPLNGSVTVRDLCLNMRSETLCDIYLAYRWTKNAIADERRLAYHSTIVCDDMAVAFKKTPRKRIYFYE